MITEKELQRILRAEVKKAGGVSKWARQHGFEKKRGNISQMVHGKRQITEEMAEKLDCEPNEKCWVLKGKKKSKPVQHVKYDDN
jgi:hypothetical protein